MFRSSLLFALQAIHSAGGTLTTAALLVAAVEWRPGLRRLALAAIALFVWLRPGIKPAGRPSALYVIVLVAILAGLVWCARAPASRRWIAQMTQRRDARAIAIAIAALMVLLVPAVLVPIVANWDVSGWMDSQSYDAYAMNILTGKAVQGSSGYMPLYQYGMAAVYYVFGHFFFAQQLVNALFCVAGLVALCLTAWTLFHRSLPAALAAGLLYIYTRQFFFALHFTQIEAWYVPLVCIVLLAWARYWQAPSPGRAAWLAAAIGIGLSTRNQGALFFAVICLAPAVVKGLDLRRRIAHLFVIAVVVAGILLPWTVRNIVVEGRWSPFAQRSAMYVGMLTDPRIGLYGIRYWEGWDEVALEYQRRYPDTTERERAYLDGARRNLLSNPGWLARAIAWRTAAFYGLLPDGLTELERIRATDWRAEWPHYVFYRTTPLLLLPLSMVALAMRPTRPMVFLAIAVAASLAIVVIAASPEDRISYPVLPLHILLSCSLFAGTAVDRGGTREMRLWSLRRPALIACAAGLVVVALAARVVVGAPNTYRLLMGTQTLAPLLRIDDALPLVNDNYGAAALPAGARARARVMLSNYMYPPKFVGPVGFVPSFATSLDAPQHYFAYLISPGDMPSLGPAMGVNFADASVDKPVREGDAAELEGVIEYSAPHSATGYWMRVEKVRQLPIPRHQMPVFP